MAGHGTTEVVQHGGRGTTKVRQHGEMWDNRSETALAGHGTTEI